MRVTPVRDEEIANNAANNAVIGSLARRVGDEIAAQNRETPIRGHDVTGVRA